MRTKKQRDLQIWSDALDIWGDIVLHQGRNKSFKNNWEPISRLADEMKTIKKYAPTLELPDSPDTGFYDWLIGFIEGKGSFLINQRQKKDHCIYACALTLDVRADDFSIVEEIQKRTNLGGVSNFKNSRSPCRASRWYIHNKGEINRFQEEILSRDLSFLTKKYLDWSIWSEAIDHWNKVEGESRPYHTPFNWEPMTLLRAELIKRRAYQDSPNSRYYDYLGRLP